MAAAGEAPPRPPTPKSPRRKVSRTSLSSDAAWAASAEQAADDDEPQDQVFKRAARSCNNTGCVNCDGDEWECADCSAAYFR